MVVNVTKQPDYKARPVDFNTRIAKLISVTGTAALRSSALVVSTQQLECYD